MQLPEQVALKGCLLGVALHRRGVLLLFLNLALLIVLRGAGKISQIVFPVRIAGGFVLVDRVLPVSLANVLARRCLLDAFRELFLKVGIFQKFLMDSLYKFQSGELQKPYCLLQLLGHHELLLQLELLTKFKGHNLRHYLAKKSLSCQKNMVLAGLFAQKKQKAETRAP